MQLFTGVSIIPQDTIADVERTDVVFVPNVMVERRRGPARARPAADRLDPEDACRGRAALRVVRRRAGARRGRAARRRRGHDALGLCAAVPRALSARDAARRAPAGADRARAQPGLLGRRVVMAGSRAAAGRQARRHRGGDPHVEAVPLSVAPRRPVALCVDDPERESRRRRRSCTASNGSRRTTSAQDIIAELVRESGLPKRSFDRRFRAATGYSPLAYVQTLRDRGGEATARDQPRPRWSRSGATSATRTPPRSAACSGASPAWRRATIAASSSRRASWRKRRARQRARPSGGRSLAGLHCSWPIPVRNLRQSPERRTLFCCRQPRIAMSPPWKNLLHMRRESPPQARSPRLRISSCA